MPPALPFANSLFPCPLSSQHAFAESHAPFPKARYGLIFRTTLIPALERPMPLRQIKFNAFMRPASIHAGAWRYPGAWPDMNFNFAHIKECIQKLEAAKFDAFFMADHMA